MVHVDVAAVVASVAAVVVAVATAAVAVEKAIKMKTSSLRPRC